MVVSWNIFSSICNLLCHLVATTTNYSNNQSMLAFLNIFFNLLEIKILNNRWKKLSILTEVLTKRVIEENI